MLEYPLPLSRYLSFETDSDIIQSLNAFPRQLVEPHTLPGIMLNYANPIVKVTPVSTLNVQHKL